MNDLQRLTLLTLAIACCRLIGSDVNAEDYRTAKVKLTHKMAIESVRYSDLCATMSDVGIDFPVLLQRSLDGENSAIKLLIWTGENVNLDGAASEGYSFTLVRAAKKIGDNKMAMAAKSLKMTSFKNTQMFFQFEFGLDNDKAAAIVEIKKVFPPVLATNNKTGDQRPGHKQPARRES